MANDRNIVLFELNEVPLRIIDQFCDWAPQSTLARILPRAGVFETISEDCVRLSPWVTWPSLYRGVNDEVHLVEHFGQDLTSADEEYPPLWKLLSKSGISTGVFGTLHTYPLPKDVASYAFYVPDTFAAGSECFPEKLGLFQDFNLSMARESPRNVAGGVQWKKALDMLRALPELGIRVPTLAQVGGQLASEAFAPWKKVRRRTFQPVLAFDIFMSELERTKPRFSTFFTNHVASSMHRYWAAAFPGDYRPEEYEFEDSWRNMYGGEIAYTMKKFDEMLTRLVEFADRNPNWLIVIATSMGQAATQARPLETQLYITDVSKFMSALGVERNAWSERPAMAPRVSVFVEPDRQQRLRDALASLRINGTLIEWHEKERGFFNIRLGQENLDESTLEIFALGKRHSLQELGLANVEIQDKSNTTAYHITSGSLIVYDPRKQAGHNSAGRPQVSALDIAPTILYQFGMKPPSYMRKPVGALVS